MTFREFARFHLLKTLLVLIVIQLGLVAFIQNYNHRPRTYADKANVIEKRTVRISPLANDSDKDEKDVLSLKNVSSPIHGSAIRKGNNLLYTPTKGFTGKDSFAYTISDGRKESNKSYIVVTVNKNLEPLANPDVAQVYSGESIPIDILDNDKDYEGDSIFIKEFTQPVYGKLKESENKLIYSATNSSAPKDSFSYRISDGNNTSAKATVRIYINSKNNPGYPWLSSDIGDAAKPGSFVIVNRTFIMEASGSDIWNNSDGCCYTWQNVNGDCEMYAKVEKLEGSNEWAKAGIMVRESLGGGSKMAYVLVSTKNGATWHQRNGTNESAEGGDRVSEIKAPYWVKINRKDNTFNFFVSPDGTTWKNIGSALVVMPKNTFIGFAVTSHNNKEMAKAVFSQFSLTRQTAKIRSTK